MDGMMWSMTWIFSVTATGFVIHVWLLSKTEWADTPYDRKQGRGDED